MKLSKGVVNSVVGLALLSVIIWHYFDYTGKELVSTPAPTAEFISAGQLQLSVEVDPRTPRVGKNTVIIQVRDADGELVRGASVRAEAIMAAMGAMPAMHAPADIEETAPGQYEGDFHITMSGEWPLDVEVVSGARHVNVSFDLATGREGIRYELAASREQQENSGAIRVDSRRRQLIGVKTARVMMMPFIRELRLVGQVKIDETRLSDISLKYDGWIGQLYADHVGKVVEKNQPLFTVYSPTLLSAQAEYLQSWHRMKTSPNAANLLDKSASRLLLWDVQPRQLERLQTRGTPENYLPYLAPQSGVIIETRIRKGGAIKRGETLLRIADLSTVWIEAEVYEADLPFVQTGTPVDVVLAHLPAQAIHGTVDYVYPVMDSVNRTVRIRIILSNSDGQLKPGMFADVTLSSDQGERLLVPEQSVIFAGEKRIVFVDKGEGMLVPTVVRTGIYNSEFIEILDGLAVGDLIVTSGNFLLASESKLKAGMEKWQ